MSTLRVGFIGLGAIGLPIARRLAQSLHITMTIFDTRPEVLKREAHLGAVASSVQEAVRDAEVIISVLPADLHVLDVASKIAEAARPGQIYLDFSTIAPRTIRQVSELLAPQQVRVIGGGLTKSVAAAELGELSIFIGGEHEGDADVLSPIYSQMATEVRKVPTAGGAKALKVLNNMIVSGLSVMGSESMVIASRNGIEPRIAAEHLRTHGAKSWPLENQVIKHVLTDELAPGRFSTSYMAKDASLAAAIALDHSRPAWFASVARIGFRGTTSLGLEDHYHPAVVRWFERGTNSKQIRIWGPVASPNEEGVTRLEAISAAARAHQALLSLDALTLLSLEGLPPTAALPHLQSGSSENDFLDELLIGRDGYPATPIASLAADLRAGIALTEDGRGLGLAWETSHNYALSLLDRHGNDATLDSIVSELDSHHDVLMPSIAAGEQGN